MQSINLNMIPGGVMPVINLTQWDEGRDFALKILNGSAAADLSNATFLISGRKSDETAFCYSESDTVKGNYVISVTGNTVTIHNTLQMAAAAGEVIATLTIKKSAADISTLNFKIMVQEHPLDGVDISETEIPAIIELAQDQVNEAEAWANGMRGDTPVTSADPQYHNNAKYWSDQAAQYAQGGLKWKGDCTFAQIPTTGMAVGDMWNITDAFTTDARFKEGAGKLVNAGTNIAWDGTYWDILATGSPAALPAGGIAGQMLVKQSSTDGDAAWGAGVYYFNTLADAQASISGGTVPNGAQVIVSEVGGSGSPSPSMAGLSDVTITSIQNGQVLIYDSTAGKWKNANVDSAVSTSSNNPIRNSAVASALANGRISFGVDANGNFGYKKDGADTVYPFKSGDAISALSYQQTASSNGDVEPEYTLYLNAYAGNNKDVCIFVGQYMAVSNPPGSTLPYNIQPVPVNASTNPPTITIVGDITVEDIIYKDDTSQYYFVIKAKTGTNANSTIKITSGTYAQYEFNFMTVVPMW